MIGRRVGSITEVQLPGDYCGPLTGYTGSLPAVFFIKPNKPESGVGRMDHVVSPPHTFRECADGSLEIRPSISDRRAGQAEGTPGDGWHGWLDEGHSWRSV